MTAVFAAIAGIVDVGQLGAAPPFLGNGQIGGDPASASRGGFNIVYGGVGTPLGALLGTFFVALYGNVLSLNGVSTYWKNIVTGLVLLTAVFIDSKRRGEQFE